MQWSFSKSAYMAVFQLNHQRLLWCPPYPSQVIVDRNDLRKTPVQIEIFFKLVNIALLLLNHLRGAPDTRPRSSSTATTCARLHPSGSRRRPR
jgi:hypothetical protein